MLPSPDLMQVDICVHTCEFLSVLRLHFNGTQSEKSSRRFRTRFLKPRPVIQCSCKRAMSVLTALPVSGEPFCETK